MQSQTPIMISNDKSLRKVKELRTVLLDECA